jgi:uncharacterized repeat protein (TIGR01451 family)
MFKHLSGQKVARWLSRHWIIAVCVTVAAAILWLGAPAWAAPVARPLGQTVPQPTPTSEDNPLATATPQPDDNSNNNNSSTDNSNDNTPLDTTDPNITFGGGGGSTSTTLTATVTVNGLNVREGPSVSYNTLGNIPSGAIVSVLSRNDDSTWWYICCIVNTQTSGWVSAQLLSPSFDASQAGDLIPLYGTTAAATPSAAAQPTTAAAQATPKGPQAGQPLAVDFQLSPYFVWQGITATLTMTVTNPNSVDANDALLSDELPPVLSLVQATADANGTVDTVTTANKRTLLLFRWKKIPADTSVTATVVLLVNPGLANGDVVDNLVATRASNAPYHAGAVTIGMPPILPPDFQ